MSRRGNTLTLDLLTPKVQYDTVVYWLALSPAELKVVGLNIFFSFISFSRDNTDLILEGACSSWKDKTGVCYESRPSSIGIGIASKYQARK